MSNRSPHHLSEALRSFLRSRFDLSADKASEEEVVDNIRKGVEFKGTNLWVLIFATFVASLGLNVNSTAVIIGAMLISPLMGPIMGMGLSVGINDFELLKRSLRNFGFMVLASIFTSTLYFFISPLSGAQSELLARTTPTTYDVLIAFFGGLAGIVAQSRKDRTSTVIPGVARYGADAAAVYGRIRISHLQFKYFIGAFYLFFINTVFIAIATFIVVRFLHYSKKEFVDKNREMRVRRSILLIVLVTIIPSVVIGYRIVKRSLFENDVKRYVNTVFQFPKTKVIEHTGIYRPDNGESYVEIYLIGEPISDEMIENARLQMPQYNLRDVRLVVRQSGETGQPEFFDAANRLSGTAIRKKHSDQGTGNETVGLCDRHAGRPGHHGRNAHAGARSARRNAFESGALQYGQNAGRHAGALRHASEQRKKTRSRRTGTDRAMAAGTNQNGQFKTIYGIKCWITEQYASAHATWRAKRAPTSPNSAKVSRSRTWSSKARRTWSHMSTSRPKR